MGYTATHAIVVARLITKGVDHGVHTFIVQLRSLKDHTPMPGVCMCVCVGVRVCSSKCINLNIYRY